MDSFWSTGVQKKKLYLSQLFVSLFLFMAFFRVYSIIYCIKIKMDLWYYCVRCYCWNGLTYILLCWIFYKEILYIYIYIYSCSNTCIWLPTYDIHIIRNIEYHRKQCSSCILFMIFIFFHDWDWISHEKFKKIK